MFYGYENPVEMPISELFDTGLMNAYTQAVRAEYEKGEKRLDDFMSKYGDFRSPFAKDVENYDAMTMGRINNVYNQLVQQGIDPLRSREGQMALAKAIRETPVSQLNMLKQSAEMGSAYQRAVQDAARRGEYNPGFEKWALENLGINSFDDYDTLKSGQWQRTAPDVWKTLGDATNTWFDEIKPTDKGRKNGFLWRGIDMDDLLNAARPRAQAFGDTQLGKYNKYLIKNQLRQRNPLLSDAELDDLTNKQFIKDIAATHSEKMQMLPETDPYAMLAEKDKYDARSAARQFAYNKELAKLKGELKGEQEDSAYPPSESTVRNKTVTTTQLQNVVNWLPKLVANKIQHWSSVMKTNKKNSKEYNDAAKYLNYWNAIKKNPYNPGKGYIPLLTKDGNGVVLPTRSLQSRYDFELQQSVRRGGSDATAKYINSKTAEFAGKVATRIKNHISSEWDKIPGTDSKNRIVDFGSGKYTYSAVKVKKMYGSKVSPLQRKFNAWLKSNNVRGYMTGETVRQDRAKGSTTSGVNTYYFNSYITRSDLDKFIQKYRRDCEKVGKKPLSQDAVMRHLGISRDDSKQFTDKNKERHYVDVYKFSTAYTEKDNPAQAFDDIEYDKSQYGTSNTYNISLNRYGESMARTDNLE